MLEELDQGGWGGPLAEDTNQKVIRATDIYTINKIAANAHERAWALEITGSRLKDFGHDPIATRRNPANDSWLVLCKA